MECAKYRVREEKFQDQRLIAEWGKEQGGRTGEERKVRNETQREQVILTLNPTCK